MKCSNCSKPINPKDQHYYTIEYPETENAPVFCSPECMCRELQLKIVFPGGAKYQYYGT